MTSSQPQHAAERLWQRFGEMFGSRFFESYGQKPSDSWKEAVKELRTDQVKAALSKVRNSGAAHPPSLPEFVALARNVKPQAPRVEVPPAYDPFHGFGQRCLLQFVLHHEQQLDEQQLVRLAEVKNRIVEQHRADGDSGDAKEWGEVLLEAFSACLRSAPMQPPVTTTRAVPT